AVCAAHLPANAVGVQQGGQRSEGPQPQCVVIGAAAVLVNADKVNFNAGLFGQPVRLQPDRQIKPVFLVTAGQHVVDHRPETAQSGAVELHVLQGDEIGQREKMAVNGLQACLIAEQ